MKIILPQFLIISLFFSSCINKESWDNSVLEPKFLYYNGLPMTTNKKDLIKILSKPDSVSKEEIILVNQQGWFGISDTISKYFYKIGDGEMCFAIYKEIVKIFYIKFNDSKIILDYKYGKIKLSSDFSYKKAVEIFSAGEGSETRNGIKTKILTFKSLNLPGCPAYEAPILKFRNGYLTEFFRYPAFHE